MSYRELVRIVLRLKDAGMTTDKAVALVAETYHCSSETLRLYVIGG